MNIKLYKMVVIVISSEQLWWLFGERSNMNEGNSDLICISYNRNPYHLEAMMFSSRL